MKILLLEEKDKILLEKIFNNVEFPINFGVGEYSDTLYGEDEIIESININSNICFQSSHGASKFVLMNEKLPYVIKIPLDGYWSDYESEDEDEEDVFIEFENAASDIGSDLDSEFNKNYCETELRFYKIAKVLSLEKFFAKTEFYKYINGKYIYIQEKVTPYKYRNNNNNKDDLKSSPLAKKMSKESCSGLAAEWLDVAISYYGEELTQKFVDFLSSDNEVATIIRQDLHVENYGFRKDGSPCLLDYSGYEL